MREIVNISTVKRVDDTKSMAYYWADSERKRNGFFVKEPMDYYFQNDKLNVDESSVVVAAFYNRHMNDLGDAVLVHVWPHKMIAKYSVIMNYDEIRQLSPKTLKKLLNNGLEMYKHRTLLGVPLKERGNEETQVCEGIVSFEEYKANNIGAKKKREQNEAFYWVISEQKRYNKMAQQINLRIDDSYKENDGTTIALFFNGVIKEVIMALIWKNIRCVAFKRIENHEELSINAPKTVERWRNNGELLFRYRDLFYRGCSG